MYSKISIVAPRSAQPGKLVSIEVKIKNLADHTIYVTPVLRVDGIVLEGSYETLVPDSSRSWAFSLAMPDIRVEVTAESWCESYYFDWHLDDTASSGISIGAPGLGMVVMGVLGMGVLVLALSKRRGGR